jgi:hypothetical protein
MRSKPMVLARGSGAAGAVIVEGAAIYRYAASYSQVILLHKSLTLVMSRSFLFTMRTTPLRLSIFCFCFCFNVFFGGWGFVSKVDSGR